MCVRSKGSRGHLQAPRSVWSGLLPLLPVAAGCGALEGSAGLGQERPVVGSSRNSTAGEWISASARSRRRFIPPEYVATLRSAASMSPTERPGTAVRFEHEDLASFG